MGVDKADADRMFLGNLQLIVAEQAWEIVKPVAYHYAFIYYLAVKNGGAGFYQRAIAIAMLETTELIDSTGKGENSKWPVTKSMWSSKRILENRSRSACGARCA
jgi:hypothetical protein